MKRALLAGIGIVLALSAGAVYGQSLPFTFDYIAEADAYADNYPGPDSDHNHAGPSPFGVTANAYVPDAGAWAHVDGGTDAEGLWIESQLSATVPEDGYSEASTSLSGTFTVQASGEVTLTAQASFTNHLAPYGYGDQWELDVWDPDDLGSPLFQLSEGSLHQEVALSGGKVYNIEFSHPDGSNEAEYDLDVRFSAIPEPTSVMLLLVGGTALLRSRRSKIRCGGKS